MKQLLSILLILSHLITGTEMKQNVDPLLSLIEIQEQLSTELQQWEFTIKEKITSKKTYHSIADEWEKDPEIQVREGHTPGSVIHQIRKEHGAITVTERLISSGEDTSTAERIIVIEGESFHPEIEKVYRLLKSDFLKQINLKNSRTYTCLTFKDDGTIENGVVLTHVASKLGVIHSKTQEETIENSTVKNEIYGYTPLWSQFFSMDGQPYNLQIAVINNADDKLEYTIGTPILINEY